MNGWLRELGIRSNPHIDDEEIVRVHDLQRGIPVVTICQAETGDGVILDYSHDWSGEPIVRPDKVLCTMEAVLDLFGWGTTEGGNPVYVSYDRLGEVLAARVKHYFIVRAHNPLPLQLAPVPKTLPPEDSGE